MRRSVRNIRLTLEYDGSAYAGWQVQKGHRSIQGELVRAIQEVAGERVTVIGAGRTDAGVHAEGQVANFLTRSRIPEGHWPRALNAHLPEDIAVLEAREVPPEFHALRDARGKVYRYHILNRPSRSALHRTSAHLVRSPLDIEAMKRAAAILVGRHDFRSFGTDSGLKRNTVRSVYKITIEREGPLVVLHFHGEGFLYNMVRSLVGTLLAVGTGGKPPEWVQEVLEARDRRAAGMNVPARGLFLAQVNYDNEHGEPS